MSFHRSIFAPATHATGALMCLLTLAPGASAQNTSGIYTCVDSRGRTLTSDRPIAACLDREQRVLNNAGIVKRVVPPSYTAEERAVIDAKRRREQAEVARVQEEKRRDRALLLRYPDVAMHNKEREDALSQIDDVIKAVNKRGKTLEEQRKEIAIELEFYQNDESKAPSWLKRRIEDNQEQMRIQQRFLIEQAQEKQRVTTRFDEELIKLRQLWAQ
ncbi:DUF4124 domain-containing protein [Hydrogenophaga crassostreae]|nr:DUF4124 domain-containing protein [Hydrogenophaga crassostreae]